MAAVVVIAAVRRAGASTESETVLSTSIEQGAQRGVTVRFALTSRS